jgi:hypothetical protein
MLGAVGSCFVYTNCQPTGFSNKGCRNALERMFARLFMVDSRRPREERRDAVESIVMTPSDTAIINFSLDKGESRDGKGDAKVGEGNMS